MSAVPVMNLVKPTIGAPVGYGSTEPVEVLIQSPALLQLIEVTYQRNHNGNNTRVIGALLGTRSSDGSIIEVKECYTVSHKEEDDTITIESSHSALYQLYKRINPSLVIIGWFSTNPVLDTFSGLIHDFFSKGPANGSPSQTVLLTIQTTNESNEVISPILKTYVATQIGVSQSNPIANQSKLDKFCSYAFSPVENKIVYDSPAELATLSWINKASQNENRSFSLPMGQRTSLTQVNNSISKLNTLIDSVISYVDKVINGEIEGDVEVGKFLLSELTTKPTSVDTESLEKIFTSHIQDTLLIDYLTSAVKNQLELSVKLTNAVEEEVINKV